MKLLAIPLGHQKTVAKWLVISQARRAKRGKQASLVKAARKKIAAQHMGYM
jgi:hypothetical protein